MKRQLTAPEVADALRVSVEHLYDLVKRGAVPAYRLNPRGKLLFDPDDVEAALRRSGRVRGGPQGDGAAPAPPSTTDPPAAA
jgi:excisionase family DNA binding protein